LVPKNDTRVPGATDAVLAPPVRLGLAALAVIDPVTAVATVTLLPFTPGTTAVNTTYRLAYPRWR
jgi:hypothetical protein